MRGSHPPATITKTAPHGGCLHLVPKRPRTFEELSNKEAYNLGRVVGVFSEDLEVAESIDGRVYIRALRGKRQLTIDDILSFAQGLPYTL